MSEQEKPSSPSSRGPAGMPSSMPGWWLLVLALALYGVFFVYSTGYIGEDYPVRATWTRHALWCALGMLAALVVSRLHPHGLGMRWLTWGGYGVSLLGLVLVLFAGQSVGGASRWLALGPLKLQPAEFAKVFTLLSVCRVLWRGEGESFWRRLRRYLWLPAIVGAPVYLIYREPSIGNAFSLVPCVLVVVCVYFVWRQLWGAMLAVTACLLIAGGVFLCQFRESGTVGGQGAAGVQLVNDGAAGGFFRGYHLKRLASFLTASGSWNERQSMMTLAGGGLTGKGYLNGTMKSLGYLPRTVAPTDFIFSVIGEEMGFLFGTLPVLALYGCLLWLGLHWCGVTRDTLSCLNGVAMVMLLAVHVFINIGMTVRLFPVIGLPLPLLSYGGSFTLAVFVALGIVYGIGRRNHQQPVENRRDGEVAESQLGINLFHLCRFTLKIGGRAKTAEEKQDLPNERTIG